MTELVLRSVRESIGKYTYESISGHTYTSGSQMPLGVPLSCTFDNKNSSKLGKCTTVPPTNYGNITVESGRATGECNVIVSSINIDTINAHTPGIAYIKYPVASVRKLCNDDNLITELGSYKISFEYDRRRECHKITAASKCEPTTRYYGDFFCCVYPRHI